MPGKLSLDALMARFPQIAETHCLADELEFVVEIETECSKAGINIFGRAQTDTRFVIFRPLRSQISTEGDLRKLDRAQ